ncbi:AraC family ligand binding domain-containing protein [Rhodococcus sp. BH5]|uniref:AraC family ligand binding domain-containing protein n=1 Tax=Rhodococcus sp. BH5 TaxID=2871702 RepID=UPI0022CD6665|nr:AraC family ligand binding domain-containing protein [Rhodococcus sp. BH5]MCZ9629666.1 AraC family ligand binding domain-containing protein [Rhodococcus sp. BH5]
MLIPALREIDDGPQLDDDSHLRESDRHTPMARAVPAPFQLTTYIVETDHITRWPEHAHIEHELIWSDRGVVNMIIDNQLWTVTPGVGLWIPRGVLHEGQANPHVAFRATLFTPELWTPRLERTVHRDTE